MTTRCYNCNDHPAKFTAMFCSERCRALYYGAATITIAGREYAVEVDGEHNGLPVYKLTGARGAVYHTLRYVEDRTAMFLIGRGMRVDPLGSRVELTDRDGMLETRIDWIVRQRAEKARRGRGAGARTQEDRDGN